MQGTEKMGRWQRKTEGRCIRRDCSIITGLNAEGYCKRCWGRKIREAAEAEECKKTEEWLRKQAKEKAKEEAPPPPLLWRRELQRLRSAWINSSGSSAGQYDGE